LNHTPIPHVNSLPSKLIDGKLMVADCPFPEHSHPR
jgi:hypothetical protein